MSEYDEMTPHELNLHASIFNEQKEREHENLITQAYLTAMWHRIKKMPSLESVLQKPMKKKEPMSDKAMYNMVRALNAAFGGEEIGINESDGQNRRGHIEDAEGAK